ncbi:MAG: 4-(cytidine 5'-diphospho)-2-C-methyl-D-erythritol kinase [Deltaproteobacteria bacterium HGW-Deltaproteobacteria-2]|jgi:4-diphosphocytidyl-2-C-methyl-D-erythritol kinase|nr:MAG: 4-(cytidine 5'-diphospho)-2-C-methyl-D-erythritol kinase [Deltaproteobacteria bacterium HGW-Deltaproteobacteria-2]
MHWIAPAKINIFLRVLNKRADGYHNIFSLMQKVTLCDELVFSPRPKGIILNCSGINLPTNNENLVVCAARAIFDYCKYSGGMEITLHKKIPVTAGLGGGSSDAATTLMALNKICSLKLRKNELIKIGAKIGADVPFFIFGNEALASGIGDKLKHLRNLPKLDIILVKPPLELSTKMVYENLNLRLTRGKNNYSIPRILDLSDIVHVLHNDLESVSLQIYPELADLKKVLLRHGALGALMSGSGPTVFGIFRNGKEAKQALEVIEKELSDQYLLFLAKSL